MWWHEINNRFQNLHSLLHIFYRLFKSLNLIIDLICDREKITHFTPHYLRHTFVTIQLSNKIPVSSVAALVGDTPETIYKVYAHSFEKDEEHASNLMDDIISLSSFEES